MKKKLKKIKKNRKEKNKIVMQTKNIISPLNNKSRIDFYSLFLATCKYVCVYTPKLYICMYFIY